jgi:hypothetical protein
VQIQPHKQAFGLTTAVRNGEFLVNGPGDGQPLFHQFRNAGLNAAHMVYRMPICMFGAFHEKVAYDRFLTKGYDFKATACNTRGNIQEIAKMIASGSTNAVIIAGGFQSPRALAHGNEFGVAIPVVPAEAIWLSTLSDVSQMRALDHMRQLFGDSKLTEEFLNDFQHVAKEISSGVWNGYTKSHFERYEGYVVDLQEEEKTSAKRQAVKESILKIFGDCPLARRFVSELSGIADILRGDYKPLTT